MQRRALLLALPAVAARAQGASPDSTAPLAFPRDHGAHPQSRIEWWYATGTLGDDDAAPLYGFQLTFFRARTGLAQHNTSRFAARQLLFAHAALTDLRERRLLHAGRVARWTGDEAALRAAAAQDDTAVHIGDWRLGRAASGGAATYRATLGDRDAGFAYALTLATTQPLLLQGDAGYSRKGPDAGAASRYYSQPQLAVSGELALGARRLPVRGRAWLDHEWSENLMPALAVGWDWIGINLADGSALTAFRLRRADGQAVWAGGSLRPRGGTVRNFAAHEVAFEPLRWWTSPATQARYPVRWRVDTPAGRFEVGALLDAQELDSRASTGTVYWEGVAELLNMTDRQRVGLGYLEMTGYAGPLRLGA